MEPPYMVAIHEKIFTPVGTQYHRCSGEIGTCIHIQTDGIHMMRPHNKANKTNSHHSIGHAEIPKNRLAGKGEIIWLTIPRLAKS